MLSTMTLLDPVTAIGDGQLQATTMASAQISIATSTSAWTSVMPMSTASTMSSNSTIAPKNVIHRKSTVRDGTTWWSRETEIAKRDDSSDHRSWLNVGTLSAYGQGSFVSTETLTYTYRLWDPAPTDLAVKRAEDEWSSVQEVKGGEYICASTKPVVLTLQDSILTDAEQRIGSVVANGQLQFDGPPAQMGAIYTAGFSVCENNTLALGGSTVWYQCRSGSFYNCTNSTNVHFDDNS